MDEKQRILDELKKEMELDRLLPLQESNLVFGEGNCNSDIVFIGEAPGFEEDRQQRPFVGRSGQLLNEMLQSINMSRDEVYITNIVKRRPTNNRDPIPEEIEAYKPYLAKQLAIIEPIIVITLGRFAMNYFLPHAKITRDQGVLFRKNNFFVVPMFHPAAALRSQTEVMGKFKETFAKVPIIIKKCRHQQAIQKM
jgi:DNA polymerase